MRGADKRLARAVGGRELIVVRGTRGLVRSSLRRNQATAPIEIDPLDGFVMLDGRGLLVEAVREVPLSRRYLLR
jgi:urease alpha subunit